jgi:hypothetical protein
MISQAFSWSMCYSSTKILKNSTIPKAGCVSLSCMLASFGKFSQVKVFPDSLVCDLCLLMISWMVAETSRYCCLSRSSFPASVESLG